MKIIEYEYSFIYLFTAASRSCPGSKKAFPRRARKKEVTKEAPAKDTLVMIMTPLIMIIMMIVMLIIMIMYDDRHVDHNDHDLCQWHA